MNIVEQATVLFDGQCGLCERTVASGMAHGRPGELRFLANTEPEALAMLEAHGLRDAASDTLVVVIGAKAHVRSAGAVRVAARMRFPRRLGAAAWLIPRPVRDAMYNYVAKRRHQWFPRTEEA